MKKILITQLLLHIPLMGLSQLDNVSSKLEVFNIQNDKRITIYQENDHFEAPNWSKDGSYMILNGRENIFLYDLETKKKHTSTQILQTN